MQISPKDVQKALPKKTFKKYRVPRVELPDLIEPQRESFRWFVEEGKVPLRKLVDMPAGRVLPSSDSASLIAGLVQGRLQTALSQKQSVGGLMELVKEFEREVKNAANAWYRETNPTDDALQGLFPGKKPLSLRNKLNTWRKR